MVLVSGDHVIEGYAYRQTSSVRTGGLFLSEDRSFWLG